MSDTASQGPLPDYLREGLDLLVVGINPGLVSAAAGHHYAGPGNLFWPLLYESGLVPEPLTAAQDSRCLEYGIGLTNLVARPSRGAGGLSREELRAGAERLRALIEHYRPRVVCFNGVGIAEAFLGRRVTPGLQPERAAGARVYVMPSTSARTAAYQRADKLRFFRELKRVVEEAQRERPSSAGAGG